MKNLAKIFLFAFVFGLFSIAPKALAAVSVTLGERFPISAENLAPGDIIERDVFVTKDDTSLEDLMILLTETGDWSTGTNDLKDRMSLKIQKPNNTYTVFPMLLGGGDSASLKGIFAYSDTDNSNAFKFDTVNEVTVSPSVYKLQFTFDPLAGNDFQAKKTEFSVSVGIFSQPPSAVITTDNNNGNNNNNNNNRRRIANPAVTGIIRTATPVMVSAGQVGGAETPTGNNIGNGETPEVAGAENAGCTEWPLWVWILMLVGYVAVINTNFYYEAKEKVRWFLPLVWTTAIFLVWYYFEKCRLYPWYPYAILIIAILSFFAYLSWMRKKVKKDGKEIE